MPKQYDNFTFPALGTVWHILTLSKELNAKHQATIKQTVAEFENNYSRFKPDSLLSQLNNQKMLTDPPPEMVELLDFALAMYKQTKGLFNISVGSKLEQDGYGAPPDALSKITNALTEDIKVSNRLITINDHVRLDFGGFGKGWLVDKLHHYLLDQGIERHIVNGGGDIRVGLAKETIYIEHPQDPSLAIGLLELQNEALAISSFLKRTWNTDSGVKTHIIHPEDRTLDNQLAQLSVRAKTCLIADSFATVLMLTPDEERASFAQRFGVQFAVVTTSDELLQTADFSLMPIS